MHRYRIYSTSKCGMRMDSGVARRVIIKILVLYEGGGPHAYCMLSSGMLISIGNANTPFQFQKSSSPICRQGIIPGPLVS